MIEDIDFTDNNNDELKVVYIDRVGKDVDGNNIYHFLCATDLDEVWCEEWGEKPACNCRNLQPDGQYEKVLELKTDVDFVLGQENCCCSYQDICDGCVAMAYENIDGYEEYPEMRFVFKYGESLYEIEKKLSKRDMFLRFITV